jgi:maltooligosyltrehalose synthase
VVAFTRSDGSDRLVCAVPRLWYARTRGAEPWPLGEAWGQERLRIPHTGSYRNLFSGASLRIAGGLRLAEMFADFPIAILLRESGQSVR